MLKLFKAIFGRNKGTSTMGVAYFLTILVQIFGLDVKYGVDDATIKAVEGVLVGLGFLFSRDFKSPEST